MMERYETYKYSGIEWIGEIPAEWDTKKIKQCCYVKGRVGWKGLNSSEFLTDGFSYLVTGTNFESGKVNWQGCYQIDKSRYEEDPYIQLQEHDLLITKDGTIGKLAVVDKIDKPACLNSGIFVVRSLNQDLDTRYLHWVLMSNIFTQFNNYTSYGSTIQHLYQNVFIEFSFGFPTFEEQIAIANFLDRKTAEIDALIAQKERLLELYEEEKTAIINHAVTRGIDPNAELKDSGVDWLGEIPTGWSLIKLRYLSNINTGEKDTENRHDDGQYPFYVRSQTIERISTYSYDGEAILTAGDGVGVGKVFHYANGKFDYHQRVYKVSNFKGVIGRYIFYYMQINFHKEVIRISAKSTVDSLRLPMLQNFPVCLPNQEDEQTAIVQHIEVETARIDAKITKTQRIIELQKEYRTALISEVVTGKIKVPELPTQEASA